MGFSSEEFIRMREEMMNYNDYVMRQLEKRYTEPDDDPCEDMDDDADHNNDVHICVQEVEIVENAVHKKKRSA